MPDFSLLPARIRLARDNTPKEVQRVVREVANAMLETLVKGTPVDTSQALSNWQAEIGSANTNRILPHVSGFRGSTRAASVAIAIALGRTIIQGYAIGSQIHLANALPYIQGLNNGTISRQPGGFVEAAILIGRDHLKQVKVSI